MHVKIQLNFNITLQVDRKNASSLKWVSAPTYLPQEPKLRILILIAFILFLAVPNILVSPVVAITEVVKK